MIPCPWVRGPWLVHRPMTQQSQSDSLPQELRKETKRPVSIRAGPLKGRIVTWGAWLSSNPQQCLVMCMWRCGTGKQGSQAEEGREGRGRCAGRWGQTPRVSPAWALGSFPVHPEAQLLFLLKVLDIPACPWNNLYPLSSIWFVFMPKQEQLR